MSDPFPDRVLPYATPEKPTYRPFGKEFISVLFLLVVGVLVLYRVSGISSSGRVRVYAQQAHCSANLKSIGTALQKYANENSDRYPDTFEELARAVQFPPEMFVCPASNDQKAMSVDQLNEGGHMSYIYLGKGRKRSEMGVDDPLVYEPLSNHKGAGANVLFGDTHVERLTPAELAKLLAAPTTLPTTTPSTVPTKQPS